MSGLVAELRHRLGPPPREPVKGLALPPLPTALSGDALARVWERGDALLRHGEVTVGFLVMADVRLWEPGKVSAPADVLYTFDAVLLRRPEALVAYAARLFAYYRGSGADPAVGRDPWKRRVHDTLYSGFERSFHERVPPELCDGYVCHYTSLLVDPTQLPDRRLVSAPLPLLVLREPGGPSALVPGALWPVQHRRAWKEAAASPPNTPP